MNIFEAAHITSRPRWVKGILGPLLSLGLLFATGSQNLSACQVAQALPVGAPPTEHAPPYTQETSKQLQQLVAPIALYPDSLIAQILAASTFPEQVVEADRWLQAHPGLQGEALAQAVDPQPWDPSVKALTAFSSVLGNMDKNLSWTSSLGDAYYNQQQHVMDAVQAMRQRAQAAGNLQTTSEQIVTTEGPTVVIQPANPDIVYVPAFNPWVVYGDPIIAWPGWYPYPGIWFGGPYLSFGAGSGIGFFGGFGWGWGHWGFDWHNRYATFGSGRYYSRSNTFYNRSNFYRGGGERGGGFSNRPGPARGAFNGDRQAARGYAEPRGQSGMRSGAFSGYDRGGQTRTFSSRGSASFGGGGLGGRGGFGGGGGFHGGGRR